MADVIVIGIAGGTGSGKTTLVKALINRFGDNISVLSHDNYYKRHDDLTYEERTKLNYDHPDAFDTDLMIGHLRALKAGRAIDCPTYDYIRSTTGRARYCTSRRGRSSSSRAF